MACGSFHTVAVTDTGDVFLVGHWRARPAGHGDLENHKTRGPCSGCGGMRSPRSLPARRTRSLPHATGARRCGRGARATTASLVWGFEPHLSPPRVELENQGVISSRGANHSGAVSNGQGLHLGQRQFTPGNGLTDEQEARSYAPALGSAALTNAPRLRRR